MSLGIALIFFISGMVTMAAIKKGITINFDLSKGIGVKII